LMQFHNIGNPAHGGRNEAGPHGESRCNGTVRRRPERPAGRRGAGRRAARRGRGPAPPPPAAHPAGRAGPAPRPAPRGAGGGGGAGGWSCAWPGGGGGPRGSSGAAGRRGGPGPRLVADDLVRVPLELPPAQASRAFTDVGALVGATVITPLSTGELVQA